MGIRTPDGEIKEDGGDGHGNVVLVTACWSSGQSRELCGIQNENKRGCLVWRRYKLRTQLQKFVFGSIDWHAGLSPTLT